MARYILQVINTGEYVQTCEKSTYLKLTKNSSKATVYSDGMLDEYRSSIRKKADLGGNGWVQVIRVI